MAAAMASIGVHLGDGVEVCCRTPSDRAYLVLPSLVVDAPAFTVSLHPAGICRVTDHDITTARAVVEAAAAYLAALQDQYARQDQAAKGAA